ncbi:MAG: hypothetical protein IPH68_16710 [Chitinophagaceae bacterium]|nr:hypothetical protein [Chitinophagaceae bacterium]
MILQALADQLASFTWSFPAQKTRTEYWGYVSEEQLTDRQLLKKNT